MSNRKKLTEEQKRIFNEKRRKTCLERYGDPNYNNMTKVKQTKLEKYGDENYNNMEKTRQTNLERYGVEHQNQREEIAQKISRAKKTPETQEKYENTCLERYGNRNLNLVPEIREKYKQTLLKNYGVENPLQNRELCEKHLKTLIDNNSYGKSSFEENYYEELCDKYGVDDVIRQYKEERYPFNCDFYIKSEDLFIEINKHPSHNTHPFNPQDENDIALLEKLKEDNSRWSNMIIDVWTIRDVEKQRIAKENNLNYRVIY